MKLLDSHASHVTIFPNNHKKVLIKNPQCSVPASFAFSISLLIIL